MNPKTISASLLIAFALGSAAYVSLRTPPDGTAAETTETAAVMVYFFDSAIRCETCERIERFAHNVVTDQFTEALAAGKVGWAKLDMDAPENVDLAREFGLFTKSVVLVRHGQDGSILGWENLKDVWELIEDKDAYDRYIEEHLRAFLVEAS